MLIGMMNDPKRDPIEEARWAADNGLEFLDLTIEGALAEAGGIDIGAIKAVLAETGLHVVGHTAPYLPFAFPVERVRRAAVAEVAALLPLFVQVGRVEGQCPPEPGHQWFRPALGDCAEPQEFCRIGRNRRITRPANRRRAPA